MKEKKRKLSQSSIRIRNQSYPKWRANAMTAVLSFHKSEIGIPFPFRSNTFTVSNKLAVSSLLTEDSIPVHTRKPDMIPRFIINCDKSKRIETNKKKIHKFLGNQTDYRKKKACLVSLILQTLRRRVAFVRNWPVCCSYPNREQSWSLRSEMGRGLHASMSDWWWSCELGVCWGRALQRE